MLTVHHTVAFLVLAVTWGAAIVAGVAYYRRREPRGFVTHLIALAQTLLVAQVGIGLLLLSEHRGRRSGCTTSTGRSRCSRPSHRGSMRRLTGGAGWRGSPGLPWWQERSPCGPT